MNHTCHEKDCTKHTDNPQSDGWSYVSFPPKPWLYGDANPRPAVTCCHHDLGRVLRTHMQLIAWCHACLHQVEADIAALVERYGPELEVPEWGARLRCSKCGSHDCDFVVSGYSPPHD